MVLAAHVPLLRKNTAVRFEDARSLVMNLNMEMKFPISFMIPGQAAVHDTAPLSHGVPQGSVLGPSLLIHTSKVE